MRGMTWQQEQEGARDTLEWTGLTWGPLAGPRAREAALWAQLQREFYNRNLLRRPAIRRLEVVGFQWQPQVCFPPPSPSRGFQNLGCCSRSLVRETRDMVGGVPMLLNVTK